MLSMHWTLVLNRLQQNKPETDEFIEETELIRQVMMILIKKKKKEKVK